MLHKGDRLRVQGVGTPLPDDTECARLSGSTPSGFPQVEAHSTREHHTPDDSISYPDMLSEWKTLTKVTSLATSHVPPLSNGVSGRPVRTSFTMDSKELSSISDFFGDQKALKTPTLNTI